MSDFENHWYCAARRYPSPNYNERPPNTEPDLVVIHNISLPPGKFGQGFIQDFFCNRLDCSQDPFFEEISGMEVSAHFLIERPGTVCQFVPCDKRAWHAGLSRFEDRENCNDFSIGIELEGTDTEPYTEAQYQSLATLLEALFLQYPRLSADRMVGHNEIAPNRKTDPGESFDWAYLRRLLGSGD